MVVPGSCNASMHDMHRDHHLPNRPMARCTSKQRLQAPYLTLPLPSFCRSTNLQAQMSAKALRRAAQEAEERAAVEAAHRAEQEHSRRVQDALRQGPPQQWHGLRKHEW